MPKAGGQHAIVQFHGYRPWVAREVLLQGQRENIHVVEMASMAGQLADKGQRTSPTPGVVG